MCWVWQRRERSVSLMLLSVDGGRKKREAAAAGEVEEQLLMARASSVRDATTREPAPSLWPHTAPVAAGLVWWSAVLSSTTYNSTGGVSDIHALGAAVGASASLAEWLPESALVGWTFSYMAVDIVAVLRTPRPDRLDLAHHALTMALILGAQSSRFYVDMRGTLPAKEPSAAFAPPWAWR